MQARSFLDHFSALEDPRQAWKVVYPLPEILLVILCGTMAGGEDFVEIERWARRKEDFLRSLLPFERGIPSHDTLNDVMNALPATLFSACMTCGCSFIKNRTMPSTAMKPPMATMAGLRSGVMPSAMTWLGSPPTAAFPANPVSLASP